MTFKLMIIRALDHYSSDYPDNDRESCCIVEFVGILIAENPKYITIKHITADINDENSAIEVHNVLKSSIHSYFEIELESIRDFKTTWKEGLET